MGKIDKPELVAITAGVRYLKKSQRLDGGYDGFASADPVNFTEGIKRATPFFTALISISLHNVAETLSIREHAAKFLLSHKSDIWSWNYLQRGSRQSVSERYPDDLDDTSCALAALYLYNPRLIDGAVQAHIAHQLISVETAPGGPYRTWLVDATADSPWRDIDIVVNANIGYMLSLLEVELPGLLKYIDEQVASNRLVSPYYLGQASTLYFLSRWYRGKHTNHIQSLILEEIKNAYKQTNVLMAAMLLTAACKLSIKSKQLSIIRNWLLQMQKNGYWQSTALYFEPPIEGKKFYSGSAALTTAFCVEALEACLRTEEKNKPARGESHKDNSLKYVLTDANKILNKEIQSLYIRKVRHIIEEDSDGQVCIMADLVSSSFKINIPSGTRKHLNLASLNGWVAYTIYDDFMDDEGQPIQISIANIAHRRMLKHFAEAMPGHKVFQSLVSETLDKMDSANGWEILNSRVAIVDGTIHLDSLPSYENLSQLAERSGGHMLAAIGVLFAADKKIQPRSISNLQNFFYHFLIARQLNDDAHDWWNDLGHGQINSVVARILDRAQVSEISLERDQAALTELFWEKELPYIASKIIHHVNEAKAALKKIPDLENDETFIQWLTRLELSVERAQVGKRNADIFVEVF